jgi:hypothetical protein
MRGRLCCGGDPLKNESERNIVNRRPFRRGMGYDPAAILVIRRGEIST